MMEDLLGLTLEEALTALAAQNITPVVSQTASPRGGEEGMLRVVRVARDGSSLVAAAFRNPLDEADRE